MEPLLRHRATNIQPQTQKHDTSTTTTVSANSGGDNNMASFQYWIPQTTQSQTITVFCLFFLVFFALRCVLFDRTANLIVADPYSARFLAAEGEPIDVVYTWVNGSEPDFITKLELYRNQGKIANSSIVGARRRFADNEELKYSLRSLQNYAPWVRNIYIVTNGQRPSWLRLDHPRLKIVTHEEIYRLGDSLHHLPTFSSPSIETHLHRIPGLSRRFLYFNDDVFLGARVHPEDFISRSGTQKIYLSWEMPDCAVGCHDSFIGDKYCDTPCNNTACNFDGGDCLGVKKKSIYDDDDDDENDKDATTNGTSSHHKKLKSSFSSYSLSQTNKRFDTCKSGCNILWIGDGICDSGCRNAQCGYDGADCPRDVKPPHNLPVFVWVNQTMHSPPLLFHANASKIRANNGWFSFLVNITAVIPPPMLTNAKITHVAINKARYNDTAWIKLVVAVNKWSSALFVTRPILNSTHTVQVAVSYDATVPSSISHNNDTTTTRTTRKSRIASYKTSFTFSLHVNAYNTTKQQPGNKTTSRPKRKSSLYGEEDDDDDDDDTGEDSGPSFSSDAYKDLNSDEPDEEGAKSATNKWKKNSAPSTSKKKPEEEDTFALSLLATKAALRGIFPKRIDLNTKVPAHMPHLIDVRLVTKLQKSLPEFFKKTSEGKFRGKDNAQFSYAYATYLMADDELERVSEFRSFFSEFIDVDQNGCVAGKTELRTLVAMIMSVDDKYVPATTKAPAISTVSTGDDNDDDYGSSSSSWSKKPVLDDEMINNARIRIWADMANGGAADETRKVGSSPPPGVVSKTISNVMSKFTLPSSTNDCLSVFVVEKSPKAFSALLKVAMENRRRLMPRFQLAETADHVTFIMLRDNSTDFLPSLDAARIKRTKFVCINDDSTVFEEDSVVALREFFNAMFPNPSEFEKIDGTSTTTSSDGGVTTRPPSENGRKRMWHQILLVVATLAFMGSGAVLVWKRKTLVRILFNKRRGIAKAGENKINV